MIESGAVSIEALAQRCGAGTDCGGCKPVLYELLAEHLSHRVLAGSEQVPLAIG